MPVDGEQDHRRVRPDRVQILLARASRREGEVAPAETADDIDWPDLVAIGPKRGEDLLAGVQLQVRAAREGGPDERMDVSFDETRQQHLAREIDDAGL